MDCDNTDQKTPARSKVDKPNQAHRHETPLIDLIPHVVSGSHQTPTQLTTQSTDYFELLFSLPRVYAG